MTSDYKAIEIRAALIEVGNANHGLLNPELVINAAREEGSVLHPFFEWDDGVAAERYRLVQARGLMRRVNVFATRRDRQTQTITLSTTRAFQSRPSQRSARGGYESVADILADAEKRAELVASVYHELLAIRKRYEELSELETVWVAIDEASSDLQPQPSPAPPTGDARPGVAG